MYVHSRIQKWGNGLALRISGALREVPHFHEGSEVDIEVTDNGFIVRKLETKLKKTSLPLSETDLLKGLSGNYNDLLASPLPLEFGDHE